MFCDLVGSTSLAAKLDAEDWRNLVNAYLDEASAAVTGFGGHVLKKLGDGLMALFGYPQAQENDAERAVRAALAIQRALAELNAGNAGKGAPELQRASALSPGRSWWTRPARCSARRRTSPRGCRPRPSRGRCSSPRTCSARWRGFSSSRSKGAHELKGVTAPVALFRVVRASGGGRRGGGARADAVRRPRGGTWACWRAAGSARSAGEGQLVQIVGEPGLGKSRLIEEFRAKLAETPHTWVEWSRLAAPAEHAAASDRRMGQAALWRGRAGRGASRRPRRARYVWSASTRPNTRPCSRRWSTFRCPRSASANFPPEELRRRQLAAVTAWVLAGARTQPVVLAFEDLHWADPTSLDLLRALAERGAQAPLLLVATTRPEFRPPWACARTTALISLAPLDRAGVRRMVGEISSRHALSKEMIEGVSERTGGVPLFVEEVTRLLLERDEQGGAQAIPPTLQQSLAARLDRLGPAREVAQIGAVLGRDFAYRLLRDVAEADEPALQASLDRLVDADLLFVEGAPPEATYRFKHALIQDAAYDSLLKSRRQALHRRAAEVLRRPERASAEPEAIAHHFTEAGLDDLAIEWWGKAGDQALRRSAFQEAIAHLGKAIAMADKAGAASTPRAAASTTVQSQRLKLQTRYGQAMMYSRGFGSDESMTAFARARNLAVGAGDASEQFEAYQGLFLGSMLRGELSLAQETAESFLHEAENEGQMTEAADARRSVGVARLVQGDFIDARTNFAEALRIYSSERDRDARLRTRVNGGAIAAGYLAQAAWVLGDVERARSLSEEALARADETAHAPTRAFVYYIISRYHMLRGDSQSAMRTATISVDLGREHGMVQTLAFGEVHSNWARAWLGGREGGMTGLREALAAYLGQGNKLFVPLFQGRLAELEAEGRDGDGALRRIEEALALASETGERWTDALLHCIRGATLLKRDSANSSPAEGAFLTAIAVAQAQKARSFELQAALALAKLYQSTGRTADAYAVLAPALEGFSSTPEMPEIAEAQALLAALAETEEVKKATASRHRRLQLQTRYGRAMMYSRGLGSDEAKAAFEGAQSLAEGSDDIDERFATLHGLFVTSLVRGELRVAQEAAETFQREAQTCGRLTEAAVACRFLGWTSYCQGDFTKAKAHLEEALRLYDPTRDGETKFRYGIDTAFVATAYLAPVTLALGDIEGARKLIDEAVARAVESAHVPHLMYVYNLKTIMEFDLGQAQAALRTTEIHAEICRRNQIVWSSLALQSAWARARLGDRKIGIVELRRALAASLEENAKVLVPGFLGGLAELEAEEGDFEEALPRIDEALALARETGAHKSDAFLHRLRGDILLKRDPGNPAPAEDALQTALAVAQRQGGRFYGLRAALSLAKLYRSTGRPAEAHAVLAPALEGFSPTPEMPEIAEAQALLVAIEAGAHVRHE